MLQAVMIGSVQPRRSVLPSRRWMRRLLLASFRRMLGFTRNPSGRQVLEEADTSFKTGKARGFRVLPIFHPPKAGDFAWLRPRALGQRGAGGRPDLEGRAGRARMGCRQEVA